MRMLVALVFAVYAAVTLLVLQARINEGTARQIELERMVQAQEVINAALLEDIGFESNEDADARIARIARERIGLVEPGEIIFVNKTP